MTRGLGITTLRLKKILSMVCMHNKFYYLRCLIEIVCAGKKL
jgi:hypothetical protein